MRNRRRLFRFLKWVVAASFAEIENYLENDNEEYVLWVFNLRFYTSRWLLRGAGESD